MIKILFFIPGLSEGGAEKVLCNLVNNMNQEKFDITVQTIFRYDFEKYLKNGIHYKSIFRSKKERKLSKLWFRICTALKLTYPMYVKDDYDIEVAYLECGATKVMAASTNKKAVKLAWVHCDLQKKGITGKKIAKQYSKFDYAVCVSRDVKKSFDKLYGAYIDSIVIRNVIDEEEILRKSKDEIQWNVNPGEKKLIAVGRLTDQKNFEHLIDTCKKLRDNGYKFSLMILGEGPLYNNLEQQIKDNHLEANISLKGFIVNPYPWIKKADYVVCSSRYEGMSTVMQEALILEKIFVTTPCTGMKELLGKSEYGLIAEDNEDGLYNSLKKIIDNPQFAIRMAVKAKERGMEFTKKNTVVKTEEFFIELFKKNRFFN